MPPDPRPVEPPPSPWTFPDLADAPPDGPIAVGGDLAPGTLLLAYRSGLFPMPMRRDPAWFSPDPRAVVPAGGAHVSRSLQRSMRRFDVTCDTSFEQVVRHCGDRRRPDGWITDEIVDAYCTLHRLGWAHSVEVWCGRDLVGGLYGVAIGAFFAGESMFHHVTDASKAALVVTERIVSSVPSSLFDVQWVTAHLRTMGAVEIGRDEYLHRLATATAASGPSWTVPPDPTGASPAHRD